ncbi:UNVERIFIED_CONTAM: hypothetical protein Slati_0042700 [Sesamum latifolium]|uniref:Pollen Ole e 1 allergen and extensin family protein n=1 Tax=Sesamum latifolium TaxID=2727402 RepID=A0AAW2Y7A6_9LAMI
MSWFWTIIFLCVAFAISSEGKHHKKHPSAVVVGTVYCDTCFQQDFPKASHFISGASVAVECKNTSSKPNFQQVVKTDKNGEFRVHLPFSISKHVKKIKKCAVKLISSNEPLCAVAATAASSSLSLKTRKHGTHVFSAGFFTFKPLKQPDLCNQKPSISSFKNLDSAEKPSVLNPNDPLFPPPLQSFTVQSTGRRTVLSSAAAAAELAASAAAAPAAAAPSTTFSDSSGSSFSATVDIPSACPFSSAFSISSAFPFSAFAAFLPPAADSRADTISTAAATASVPNPSASFPVPADPGFPGVPPAGDASSPPKTSSP